MAEKVGLMTGFFITLRGDFSSKSRNREAILTALAVHEMCETSVELTARSEARPEALGSAWVGDDKVGGSNPLSGARCGRKSRFNDRFFYYLAGRLFFKKLQSRSDFNSLSCS